MPENRGQKVDIIGHFGETVFLVFGLCCPKMKEGEGGEAKIMCSL